MSVKANHPTDNGEANSEESKVDRTDSAKPVVKENEDAEQTDRTEKPGENNTVVVEDDAVETKEDTEAAEIDQLPTPDATDTNDNTVPPDEANKETPRIEVIRAIRRSGRNRNPTATAKQVQEQQQQKQLAPVDDSGEYVMDRIVSHGTNEDPEHPSAELGKTTYRVRWYVVVRND